MINLYDELKNLIVALNEKKIDYALCGGLAMAVHELPRATIDIDLLTTEQQLPALLDVAAKREFTLKGLDMSFAGGNVEIRRVSRIEHESGEVLTLDVLLVTPAFQNVWKTREKVIWENNPLWVVSREGLIKLKSYRMSGQDRDDIKRLRGEYEN